MFYSDYRKWGKLSDFKEILIWCGFAGYVLIGLRT